MTTKGRSESSKPARRGRLKLKRETLKDLGGARAKGVKGGRVVVTAGCQGGDTADCGGGTGTVGCGGATVTGMVTCACMRR